ncbi:MAG: hypothetical protein LBG59_02625 [Candidatus Peribacteria bacterium]|jgi:hypothetical protein|nr:hypothetical protein [Candidatus Peribacteria bacterium]
MMHREGLKLITTDEISPTTNIGIDMNNFSEEHLLRMLENMGTDNIDYSSIMQTL